MHVSEMGGGGGSVEGGTAAISLYLVVKNTKKRKKSNPYIKKPFEDVGLVVGALENLFVFLCSHI